MNMIDRVNKFEKMAATATAIQESKPLWAYKVKLEGC